MIVMSVLLVRCGFGSLADARMHRAPSVGHMRAILVGERPHHRVPELDERAVRRLAEAIHHVRRRSGGHEQRPPDLEQCGTLDALHEPPQVAIVAAEIAIPATARMRLDDHWQWFAVSRFVEASDLCDERLERLLDGRMYVDVFRD